MYATFDKPVDGEREAHRQRGTRRRLRQVRHDRRQDGDDADRDVADRRRPGAQEPRARDRAGDTFEAVEDAGAAAVGRKLERDRGRGRDRRPADDAVLEPLPAQPLSELGVREHRHGGEPASTSTPCSRRRRSRSRRARATQTGAPVVPGKVYVNNGFWDTYRTTWSAYSLLYPTDAGELVDGFVQQYRDGGWIARWSSPGYANLMTGTSSDVAFADAYVKGVRNFDAKDAYDAALKNATVAPPGSDPNDTNVGRKGLRARSSSATRRTRSARACRGRSRATSTTSASRTWPRCWPPTRAVPAADRRRYQDEYEYFRERARNYVNMFDRNVGFFQGSRRPASGSRRRRTTTRSSGATSTTTPRPTAGTSRSTRRRTGAGSRTSTAAATALAAKLDAFFSTPGDRELSRLVRRHHPRDDRGAGTSAWASGASRTRSRTTSRTCTTTPASRPKTQAKVREALRRHVPRQRDRPGLRRRRGQRRDLGLVPLQRARLLPARRWAASTTRSARRCSRRRPCTWRTARTSSSARRTTARDNVYVQGLTVNGMPATTRRTSRQRQLANGGTLAFDHGPAAVAVGDAARRRAAVDHDGRQRRRGRCATRSAAAAAMRDGERRRRAGGPVRRQLGHRGRRSTVRTRGSSTASPETRSTWCASTR